MSELLTESHLGVHCTEESQTDSSAHSYLVEWIQQVIPSGVSLLAPQVDSLLSFQLDCFTYCAQRARLCLFCKYF